MSRIKNCYYYYAPLVLLCIGWLVVVNAAIIFQFAEVFLLKNFSDSNLPQ